MKRLAGTRVLVTGGSRGLGRAFCREFARQGARVAFNYTRDEAGAAQIVEEGAGSIEAFKISVLDAAGMNNLTRDLEQRWGGIDVLVNNAGMSQPLPIALLDESDWDRVMDLNVKGTYLAARLAIRGMVRRKAGHILNIGSLAGTKMLEAPAHYCASKAAVKALTEALAKDLAAHKIRVNCLAPGLLEDGVGKNLPDHRLRDYLDHVALGRVGTLEEVAKCAAFLVSDLNSYMNGATVLIDGGF